MSDDYVRKIADELQDVLAELNAGPEAQDQSDDSIFRRLVEIRDRRRHVKDEEKALKHESALLTKELEKRFAESDTHSIKKKIDGVTWNFAMSRHLQAKDADPERTARWFEDNGYPGLATVNNKRLCSMLQELLHDESLSEWVNDPDRLPEGLRECVIIGERTTLSLRSS